MSETKGEWDRGRGAVELGVVNHGRHRSHGLRRRSRRWALAACACAASVLLSRQAAADEEEKESAASRAAPPVVIIAPPPPEAAPPSPPAPPPEPAPDEAPEHRFELSFAGATFSPSLADVRFHGSGVPAGSAARKTLSITGREVGLRRPTFWGGELAIGYRHRYFGVLALGTIASIDGADSKPSNPEAAAQLGAGSVTAYGGGIEAFGAVPLGPVTVSLGAAAGLRGFSAPLLGFEPTTCTRSTRRGRYSYPCAETATTNIVAWVQPRIRLDVALDAKRVVFLGGFLGVDALGGFSQVGGVVLGIRL